jgi:hypothetical protein
MHIADTQAAFAGAVNVAAFFLTILHERAQMLTSGDPPTLS